MMSRSVLRRQMVQNPEGIIATVERYRDALEELETMADGRADCDCVGDPPRYVPNDWMEALTIIRTALGKA